MSDLYYICPPQSHYKLSIQQSPSLLSPVRHPSNYPSSPRPSLLSPTLSLSHSSHLLALPSSPLSYLSLSLVFSLSALSLSLVSSLSLSLSSCLSSLSCFSVPLSSLPPPPFSSLSFPPSLWPSLSPRLSSPSPSLASLLPPSSIPASLSPALSHSPSPCSSLRSSLSPLSPSPSPLFLFFPFFPPPVRSPSLLLPSPFPLPSVSLSLFPLPPSSSRLAPTASSFLCCHCITDPDRMHDSPLNFTPDSVNTNLTSMASCSHSTLHATLIRFTPLLSYIYLRLSMCPPVSFLLYCLFPSLLLYSDSPDSPPPRPSQPSCPFPLLPHSLDSTLSSTTRFASAVLSSAPALLASLSLLLLISLGLHVAGRFLSPSLFVCSSLSLLSLSIPWYSALSLLALCLCSLSYHRRHVIPIYSTTCALSASLFNSVKLSALLYQFLTLHLCQLSWVMLTYAHHQYSTPVLYLCLCSSGWFVMMLLSLSSPLSSTHQCLPQTLKRSVPLHCINVRPVTFYHDLRYLITHLRCSLLILVSLPLLSSVSLALLDSSAPALYFSSVSHSAQSSLSLGLPSSFFLLLIICSASSTPLSDLLSLPSLSLLPPQINGAVRAPLSSLPLQPPVIPPLSPLLPLDSSLVL
ncbi:hypothetical protein C7M84_019113 [Penaeus vannamei]|uniref:Uncharacterized protein n=1 Tax=Penaeus vannamei TaxID=6689 RepID=A0A3R7SIY3_PENVA|nr:hypothetical protein C7M84_019113 [Penaeus vannamei]